MSGYDCENCERLDKFCQRAFRQSGKKTVQIIRLRQRAEAAERVVEALQKYSLARVSWMEVTDALDGYEEQADASD